MLKTLKINKKARLAYKKYIGTATLGITGNRKRDLGKLLFWAKMPKSNGKYTGLNTQANIYYRETTVYNFIKNLRYRNNIGQDVKVR